MRIDGYGRVMPGGGGSARTAPASGAFRLADGNAPASAATAAPLRQAPGLDSLLALQAAEPETARERRRRALNHGRGMLDALDGMKLAIIEGRESAGALASLVAQLGERRAATDDDGLDKVLAAIELRAQVELAKRGR